MSNDAPCTGHFCTERVTVSAAQLTGQRNGLPERAEMLLLSSHSQWYYFRMHRSDWTMQTEYCAFLDLGIGFPYVIMSNTFYNTISSSPIHLLKYQFRLLLPTHYSRNNKSFREGKTNANTSSDRPTALNATSIQGDRYTPQRYYVDWCSQQSSC